MLSPAEQRIGEHKGIIIAAAHKFRRAAEFDDLYQEGMIAVWLCPPDADSTLVAAFVYNRMKKWVKFVKMLRHNHSVSYGKIVNNEVQE
jgi:DNA-directed RNA polymerase specialized sigma24 family protein